MLKALNQSGPQDHRWMLYSGLGHLISSADSSYNFVMGGGRQEWFLTETSAYDGLGNQTTDTRAATNIPWANTSTFSESGTAYHYTSDGTARLARDVGPADDSMIYNAAGENEFQYSTFSSNSYRHDRASFYAADNTLRAVDNRTADVRNHLIDGGLISTFEEYRYDALGRRVLTRSHHYCDGDLSDGVMCVVSFIRRTIWDGSEELGEIQMPAGDSATTAPVASTALVETDTGRIAVQPPKLSLGGNVYDANAFFGQVLYTYGLDRDQPLSLRRSGYVEDTIWSLYPIPNPQDTLHYFAPFTVVPHWDNRGLVDLGTFTDGGYTICETVGSSQRCGEYFIWPYGQSSYYQQFIGWSDWLGSLVAGKQDASGLLYRRNRYLDPATGRFTQEDPLGIAGGLNTYGYANGDPVTYSDPFGLCPPTDDNYSNCPSGSVERARGANRTQEGTAGTQAPPGLVVFTGATAAAFVGVGGEASAGIFTSRYGSGPYLHVGAGAGIDLAAGVEAGVAENLQAFRGSGVEGCAGALTFGGCASGNKAGRTLSGNETAGTRDLPIIVSTHAAPFSYTFAPTLRDVWMSILSGLSTSGNALASRGPAPFIP